MDEFDYNYDEPTEDVTPKKVSRTLFNGDLKDPQIIDRWDRINEKVQLQDVIAELHDGESREIFSCPFHGSDTRPSFKVYPAKNNAWCFGCPNDKGYYDSVKFAAAKLECSYHRAIVWLEKKYNLPPMEAQPEQEDEDDDGRVVYLTFEHLKDPFIKLAAAAFLKKPDPRVARRYISIFFNAVPDGNPESPEEIQKALALAKVLGGKALERIKINTFGPQA